ncbi:hypothetical protein K9N68_14540 [Kovacikia minuta CCNUW1]|uniref:hypothetical protein n=1 Tax=Kovacikia minuta TaxID=2931930 RepID=UPI001CC971A0|nr:hypothetical protein [Kovacikia minuta]UBF28946.1 hypothetical protein K9N68_14540 [Kovacikia minuta CCNUW1]
MPAQVQFCVVETDGSRLGKLSIPHRKSADWINFLVSPRQQVQIVFAEERRGGINLYFQADERLYAYLQTRLTSSAEESSTVVSHQPLREAIAN